MKEFLDWYIDNNGSPSHHTLIAMKGNLKRLEKVLGKPFDEFKVSDFNNVEEIAKKLKDKYSLSTRTSAVLAIRQFMRYKKVGKDAEKPYDDLLAELVAEKKDNDTNQEKTPNEREGWIEWDDLQQKVSELVPDVIADKTMGFTVFRNFLLVALFSLQPPTRIGNYLDMKYRDASSMKRDGTKLKKNHNYIIHEGDGKYTFVFNNYKTAKSVGQLKHKVENDILNQVIHHWFSNYNVKRKEFLTTADGKPMSQASASNALVYGSRRFLHKPTNLNTYRHMFLTHFMSQNPTIEEKQKVLTLVGHKYTPSTTEKYTRV